MKTASLPHGINRLGEELTKRNGQVLQLASLAWIRNSPQDQPQRDRTNLHKASYHNRATYSESARNRAQPLLQAGRSSTDLDLYLYRSNPIDEPNTRAFDRTRPGLQDDGAFTMVAAEEDIYVEIRKNPPACPRDDFSLCLQIIAYPTENNRT